MNGDDDDLEIGSDFDHFEPALRSIGGRETQLREQSTKMTSMEFKTKEDFSKFATAKNRKQIDKTNNAEQIPVVIDEEKG